MDFLVFFNRESFFSIKINRQYLNFCHLHFPFFCLGYYKFASVQSQVYWGSCEAVPTWLVSVQWTGLLGSTWPLVPCWRMESMWDWVGKMWREERSGGCTNTAYQLTDPTAQNNSLHSIYAVNGKPEGITKEYLSRSAFPNIHWAFATKILTECHKQHNLWLRSEVPLTWKRQWVYCLIIQNDRGKLSAPQLHLMSKQWQMTSVNPLGEREMPTWCCHGTASVGIEGNLFDNTPQQHYLRCTHCSSQRH